MFGFLKKKKEDDFGDIRSGVLSEPNFDEPDFPSRQSRETDFPPRAARQQGPPPGFEDPLQPRKFDNNNRFDDRPQFDEPAGFGSIDVRQEQRGPRNDYDTTDRLNLIESQLAAIRSMTETINERLKNMESRMGYQRRYLPSCKILKRDIISSFISNMSSLPSSMYFLRWSL